MTSLVKTLKKLQEWLRNEQIPFMVIGGIANFIWGEPRLTQDIDITVEVPEKEIEELVTSLSKAFKVLPKHPVDFVKTTRVLPLDIEGVRIDLILAGLEYEELAIQRAVDIDMGELKARVCTAEDLIIHKAISERERDWEDIEGVLLKQKGNLDKSYLTKWLKSFSQALEKPNILKRFEKMWSQLVEK